MEAIEPSPQMRRADDGVLTFVEARPRMFAAAFRTLGNAAEAEDVVQDAWLRWQNVDRALVRNAPAFLTTTTVRLAINRVIGARTRHEAPLPLRLVEPIDVEAGPSALAERAQALELALRLLIEKLSPIERTAYLLREAFGYDYRHIARVVRVSEENSRQLVSRARKHLADRQRVPASEADLRRITNAFIDATQTGDLTRLEAFLCAEMLDSRAENVTKRLVLLSKRTQSGGSSE